MALATGAIVANLYYLQPLLHQVAASFHVGSGAAASLITLTQLGYGLALAFIVPLGDLHPRRLLVVAVVALAAVAMALGTLLQSFPLFALDTLLVGVASVGGQIMIPFAADLAAPAQRGRTVARLMSGLLLGILLSRTVSGSVAQLAGWRAVYAMAAALMAALAVALFFALPAEPERPHVPYRRLVLGPVRLLASLPELRRRAWLGASCFAAFSVLWTTLAFELSSPRYQLSEGVIGLFGLFGVAGVLAANVAGKLADQQRTVAATTLAGLLVAASFGLLAIGGDLLVAIMAGIVVLDLGVQGMQITNQAIIYELKPAARSQINSAYMVCYFAGGALGSLLGGLAYATGGWGLSSALGALFGLSALIPALRWRQPALSSS